MGRFLMSNPNRIIAKKIMRSLNKGQTPNNEYPLFSELVDFLDQKKAKNVFLLDVQHRGQHFTHTLIVTALSTLHLKSLAEECIRFVRSYGGHVLRFNRKEFETGWAIIDFGDLVLHLFLSDLRKKYNLEELYSPVANVLKTSEA